MSRKSEMNSSAMMSAQEDKAALWRERQRTARARSRRERQERKTRGEDNLSHSLSPELLLLHTMSAWLGRCN